MANITLLINSNWSTCSDGNNTGSPPGSSDNIYLNGFSLTLNTAASETYTCALIKACASNGTTFTAGTIVMGAAASQILNANITSGTVNLLTILNGKTITIGGTATAGSGTTANVVCILVNSGGTLTSITSVMGGGSTATGLVGIEVQTGGYVGSIGSVQSGDSVGGAYGAVVRVGSTINSIGTTTGNNWTNSVVNQGTIGSITTSQGGYVGNGVSNSGNITSVGSAIGGTIHTSYQNLGAGIYTTAGTIGAVSSATGGTMLNVPGVNVAGGTVTVTSAKGGTVIGAYGVAYQSGICTVNGTDLTGVGGAVGLGSSASKLRMAANTAIGLWDSATGLSQILMPESTGVAASSDVLSGTPKWTGATTPNIGTMPIYMLKTGKI